MFGPIRYSRRKNKVMRYWSTCPYFSSRTISGYTVVYCNASDRPKKEVFCGACPLSWVEYHRSLRNIIRSTIMHQIVQDAVGLITYMLWQLYEEGKVSSWRIKVLHSQQPNDWDRIAVLVFGDFQFQNHKEYEKFEDNVERALNRLIRDYRRTYPEFSEDIDATNTLLYVDFLDRHGTSLDTCTLTD